MEILLTNCLIFALSCISLAAGNIEPIARQWKVNGAAAASFLKEESTTGFLKQHLQQSIISTKLQNKFTRALLQPNFENGAFKVNDEDEFSPGCLEHVQEWQRQISSFDLEQMELWALEMIDAWGKFPEGILSGHFMVPGDFDECLGVRATANISGQLSNFKGQYCWTALAPLPFQIGTCYPSTCSKEDVTTLQSRFFGMSGIEFNVQNLACYTDDKPELTAGDISMIAVLAVLAAFCVIGTVVDLALNTSENPNTTNQKGLGIQCLVAFSVYTNTMKFLGTKSGGDNFGCIHGLRFLSTSWVVLCHTWSTLTMQPIWNFGDVLNMQKDRWTIFAIINGSPSVDTFFTMSGLLFAYNLLKLLDKTKGKFNVPMFYLHRYLRLTPTYALLVGIMATWFVYLGDGPNWHNMFGQKTFCQNNWWHNLLYINNLITYKDGDASCHGETWYLANDMQFFIISPLFIYLIWKWNVAGMIFMAIATLASVGVPFAVTYDLELLPTGLPLHPNQEGLMEFMSKSYIKPWMRLGPYMAGLWGGYFLYQFAKTKKPLVFPKIVVLAGWIISTGTALAIIYGIQGYFKSEPEIPRFGGAVYAGVHRFAWGVVITWIIIACSQGYGGWVNRFLSWKVFMPLGRLSFCVYLISYQLQMAFHSRVRQAVSYDVYTTVNLFFGHLVMSLFVGFICCITMESPFIVLEKLIFQGGEKSSRKSSAVAPPLEEKGNQQHMNPLQAIF